MCVRKEAAQIRDSSHARLVVSHCWIVEWACRDEKAEAARYELSGDGLSPRRIGWPRFASPRKPVKKSLARLFLGLDYRGRLVDALRRGLAWQSLRWLVTRRSPDIEFLYRDLVTRFFALSVRPVRSPGRRG